MSRSARWSSVASRSSVSGSRSRRSMRLASTSSCAEAWSRTSVCVSSTYERAVRSGSSAHSCRTSFPTGTADHLRAAGIELTVDAGHFRERRRVEVGGRARRDPARSASHGGCDGFRSRPSPAGGGEERRSRRRRRGADVRAAQAPRGSGVRRERRRRRTSPSCRTGRRPRSATTRARARSRRTTSSCSISSRSIERRPATRT